MFSPRSCNVKQTPILGKCDKKYPTMARIISECLDLEQKQQQTPNLCRYIWGAFVFWWFITIPHTHTCRLYTWEIFTRWTDRWSNLRRSVFFSSYYSVVVVVVFFSFSCLHLIITIRNSHPLLSYYFDWFHFGMLVIVFYLSLNVSHRFDIATTTKVHANTQYDTEEEEEKPWSDLKTLTHVFGLKWLLKLRGEKATELQNGISFASTQRFDYKAYKYFVFVYTFFYFFHTSIAFSARFLSRLCWFCCSCGRHWCYWTMWLLAGQAIIFYIINTRYEPCILSISTKNTEKQQQFSSCSAIV